MKFIIILFILCVQAHATSDIDTRLDGYITKFNLKNLPSLPERNPNLLRLGQMLFTSRLLSGNNNISCVECHHPRLMSHDNLPLALGEGATGFQTSQSDRKQAQGKIIPRNSTALFNLHSVNVLFWDGRVSYDPITQKLTTPTPLSPEVSQTLKSALAAQALFPLVSHEEMLGTPGSNKIASAGTEIEAWELLVEKLQQDEKMKTLFEKAFPGEKINIGHVGEGLAEFQRHAFYYVETPYDLYLQGDKSALSPIQKKGMEVFFNQGKCGECHQGEQLSNLEFHNVGVPQIGPGKENGDDFGRYQWDQSGPNLYAFRVPPLRNVALTAPYMHDGAFKTLPEVVDHYNMVMKSLNTYKIVNEWKGYTEPLKDHDRNTNAARMNSLSPKLNTHLMLQDEERLALIEFLQTALTDKSLLPSL